jgi:hypothetical protein
MISTVVEEIVCEAIACVRNWFGSVRQVRHFG